MVVHITAVTIPIVTVNTAITTVIMIMNTMIVIAVTTKFIDDDIVKRSMKNQSGTYGKTRKTLPQGEKGYNF